LGANWLGVTTTGHGFIYDHRLHFGAFYGFLKRDRILLNIVWLCTVWIIWKEHNDHIFHHKGENL
jgi:hypothetical protein